ncbi:MAG: alpha/beta hydrolase [Thermoplasmatota archaeon]
MEERFVVVNGAKLYVQAWLPKKPKRAVILAHGFNSDLRELGDLPASLLEAGIAAYAFDQQGFGRSEGEAGRVDLGRFTAAIEALLQMAREDGCQRIAGLGHSLGASLMLGYASRGGFDALALAHPVRCLWDELRPHEQLYFGFMGRRGKKRAARGLPEGEVPYTVRAKHIAREPHAIATIKEMQLLRKRVNTGNYDFARTMNAEQWARRIQCPALFVTSPHDTVVQPANSLKVLQAVRTDVTHIEHLGGHSCFLDHDRSHVIDEVVHWLEDTL